MGRRGPTRIRRCSAAVGAELEARDEDGNTPLHWAAAKYNENPAVVQVLLAAGAELEVRDKDGVTPLHRAAAPGTRVRQWFRY